MDFITPLSRVTLVHHHGHHALSIGSDGDVVEAPTSPIVPPGGQCHHGLVVRVVVVVTLGGAAAVSAVLKAVESQIGLGVSTQWRRALVDFVHFTLLATI